jgi:hypothetical protein
MGMVQVFLVTNDTVRQYLIADIIMGLYFDMVKRDQ